MSAYTEDGKRVVAAGPDNNWGFEPVSKLYVFEIPDTHTFPTRQQDGFQDGNFRGLDTDRRPVLGGAQWRYARAAPVEPRG